MTQTLVFEDLFGSGSVPDPAKWSVYNSPGNAGYGLRRPSAFSVSGGLLTVTADMVGGSLVSGGMACRLNQKYGSFEVRVKTESDPSLGMSGVVLTWPQSGRWPQDGENDFYETGKATTSRNPFFSYIHYGAPPAGSQVYFTHGVAASDWHTLRMDWTPGYIAILRDGVEVWRTTNLAAIPDTAHHLCIQLDAFKSSIAGPVRMFVDYVRIWEYEGVRSCTAAALPSTVGSLVAGDQLSVLSGTSGRVVLSGIHGTKAQPIVCKAQTTHGVKIDASGSSASQAAIDVFDCSYVTFQGFEVVNTTGRGAVLYRCNHSFVNSCDVHDTWDQPIMLVGDDCGAIDNDVHDAILKNVDFALSPAQGGWPSAISTYEDSIIGADGFPLQSQRPIIWLNTVSRVWGEGIGPHHSDGARVVGNTITDTFSVALYFTEARGWLCEDNTVTQPSSRWWARFGRPADGASWANEPSGTGGAPSAPIVHDGVLKNNTLTGVGNGIFYWHSPRPSNNTYYNVSVIGNVVVATIRALRIDPVAAGNARPWGNHLGPGNSLTGGSQVDLTGWKVSTG